jgi:hypothetical protein
MIGALERGLAYLSWCNSGWFCHKNCAGANGCEDDPSSLGDVVLLLIIIVIIFLLHFLKHAMMGAV